MVWVLFVQLYDFWGSLQRQISIRDLYWSSCFVVVWFVTDITVSFITWRYTTLSKVSRSEDDLLKWIAVFFFSANGNLQGVKQIYGFFYWFSCFAVVWFCPRYLKVSSSNWLKTTFYCLLNIPVGEHHCSTIKDIGDNQNTVR